MRMAVIGADRVKGPLVAPGGAAGVDDCVGEREEELDVPLDPMLANTMVVEAGDELREQGPVPGRKLGVGTVRPVLGDHLLLVGEPCTEVEQGLRLTAKRVDDLGLSAFQVDASSSTPSLSGQVTVGGGRVISHHPGAFSPGVIAAVTP
jgi:hypothetical protein